MFSITYHTEQSYNPNLELKIFGTAELGTEACSKRIRSVDLNNFAGGETGEGRLQLNFEVLKS